MQAIVTRGIGQTTHRPARISATSASGCRVVISRDAIEATSNGPDKDYDIHKAAAVALCQKMNWGHASLIGGGLNNYGDMVWVFSKYPDGSAI